MASTQRIMTLCERCHGTGKAKDPLDDIEDEDFAYVTCSDCNGLGAIHTGWVVEVELPSGGEEPPISDSGTE